MKVSNTITISLASSKSDLSKIISDIQSAMWLQASEVNPNDYTIEDLKVFVSTPGNVFCLAFLENKFAGMASAAIRNRPDGDTWLYIDEIDVCKNMIRNKVGTSLMQYLLDYAKSQNCNEVWLGTEQDNIPANSLYTSLKPDEIEEFTGYTFNIKK